MKQGARITLRCIALPIIAVMMSVTCYAASVTYTYTGTNFLYIESCSTCIGNPPVTTANRITAFFTLSDPLPANGGGGFAPIDWAMSDGVTTLNAANSVLGSGLAPSSHGFMLAETNSVGSITLWRMSAGTPANVENDTAACLAGTRVCIGMFTAGNLPGGNTTINEDFVFYYPFGGANTSHLADQSDGIRGSWICSPISACSQTSPVPEVPSLVLVGVGLAGLSLSYRRFS
jgi:hypothetical protein